MCIASFNVKGIRARPHQLEALRDKYDPDVIDLQEVKVQGSEFPVEMVDALDYHVNFYGQKGNYGVAMLSQEAPLNVVLGMPSDNEVSQKRLTTATHPTPKSV